MRATSSIRTNHSPRIPTTSTESAGRDSSPARSTRTEKVPRFVSFRQNEFALERKGVSFHRNRFSLKRNRVSLQQNLVSLQRNGVSLKRNRVALQQNAVSFQR